MADSRPRLSISTIVISIIMIALPFTFFYLLNSETSAGFGLNEISLAILFAVFSIGFLLWVKSYMSRKPYLGLLVGIGGLIAFLYGLIQEYYGPYTTIFSSIGSIVVIVYLGYFFVKHRRNYSGNKPESFE